MTKIISKTQLASDVFAMTLEAPEIARARRAGQFIILQVTEEYGERIPLTISDSDSAAGTIGIIFQAIGATTRLLASLNAGDSIAALAGPLGSPTHIERFGRAVCVGGGIGVAPLLPIAQAMKDAGNHLTIILGARNKSLILLEDRMRELADELIIVTDDGSSGRKGLVTEPLRELCESAPKPDFVFVVGPPMMMKFCAATTEPFGIKTVASLNTIMIDGTGMCGGCRVIVGGEMKFVCVDGPEFDAHKVDWDNMAKRNRAFRVQEQELLERHICKLSTPANRD